LDLGERYEAAVENFERVLEVDDDDSNAYFSIGLAYFKSQEI
jgi:tetratricopeptide (TPR) repeat protein